MRTVGEKMQCSNGNEPLSLNYLILCFFAPSVLLFVSPFVFFPLSASVFWATGDRIPAPLLSLSQILHLPLTLFTRDTVENKKKAE